MTRARLPSWSNRARSMPRWGRTRGRIRRMDPPSQLAIHLRCRHADTMREETIEGGRILQPVADRGPRQHESEIDPTACRFEHRELLRAAQAQVALLRHETHVSS